MFDILPLLTNDGDSTTSAASSQAQSPQRLLRIARVLRLIKMVRLMRASRVASRLSEYNTWPVFYTTLARLFAMIILVAHYFACSVTIMTIFSSSPLDTWLATFGYCSPVAVLEESEWWAITERHHLSDGTPSPTELVSDDRDKTVYCAPFGILYFISLKWAMGLIVAQGLSILPEIGPFEPYYSVQNPYRRPLTFEEDLFITVLKFLGVIIWALIFSSLIKAISKRNPDLARDELDLDSLNMLCRYYDMPGPMARELRRYITETQALHRHRLRAEFCRTKLSPILAQKASAFINRDVLNIALFRHVRLFFVDDEVNTLIADMMTRMTPEVFAPQDRPPIHRLYYVSNGSAIYDGKVVAPGQLFGERDVAMQIPKLGGGEKHAWVISYLHVKWLARADFERLRTQYPKIMNSITRWVLWAAVKYIILQNYRVARASSVKEMMGKLGAAQAKAEANKLSRSPLSRSFTQGISMQVGKFPLRRGASGTDTAGMFRASRVRSP